jgi:hypothetical protein
LREFDVEEGRFTGNVATFSNSLVFVSPAIGLLKFNSAPGKAAKAAANNSGMGEALERCRRPEVSTNCQRRTSGPQGVMRHSVDFGFPVTAMTQVISCQLFNCLDLFGHYCILHASSIRTLMPRYYSVTNELASMQIQLPMGDTWVDVTTGAQV